MCESRIWKILCCVAQMTVELPTIVFPVLPFNQVAPALDASTVSTMLGKIGVPSKVVYFNGAFASLIGSDFYSFVAAGCSLNGLLGEWVFREAAFGPTNDKAFLRSLLERKYVKPPDIPKAIHARKNAEAFILGSLAGIDWRRIEVVCFLDTFAKRDAVAGQMMSSLAMAKHLKRHKPHITTVMCGPSTEGEMGAEIGRLTFVDAVFEAGDLSVVADQLASLLNFAPGNVREVAKKGAAKRQFGHSVSQGRRRLNYPVPDFDDYFNSDEIQQGNLETIIPMQTSIGCWWAERNHCTFCGLPGMNKGFVSKSPADALAEFQVQISRYSPKKIEMNDLIIDHRYLNTVIPKLADFIGDSEIFFETKSYLRDDQIATLAQSGIKIIQAGIESLSERTLSKMSKGVSASRNIEFLTNCKRHGLRVYWNYLHSFPSETASDIDEACELIPQLVDLEPPATFQPVRVERYSPYFENPSGFGIKSIKPDRSYSHIFDGTSLDVDRLAYFFEHTDDFEESVERGAAINRLSRAIQRWRKAATKRGLSPLS